MLKQEFMGKKFDIWVKINLKLGKYILRMIYSQEIKFNHDLSSF